MGPQGTFTELAALNFTESNKGARLIPLPSVYDVLHQVSQNKIEFGVVPIENSLEGTIGNVLDQLVRDKALHIYSEHVLPVEHALLGLPGAQKSKITDIYSHPQAFEQCQQYLRKNCPKAKKHMTESTAQAAKGISKMSDKSAGAIGRADLAKLLKLDVLEKTIQDNKENYTRFVMVGRNDHPPTGNDKTSIVFSLEKDRPGGLASILNTFAEQEINLTKIESRPRKTGMGDYYFFIDCVGHREDKHLASILKELPKKIVALRILGSYPAASV